MIFIPNNRIPYAEPTNHEIIKDDRGYVVGWEPVDLWKEWGEPLVFSSLREMAKDIIKRQASLLDMYFDSGIQIDWDVVPFYGIVRVKWKPEVECTAVDRASFKIDKTQFLEELTKELQVVAKLIPFM